MKQLLEPRSRQGDALQTYWVESVARACDILAAFPATSERLNLKSIAERTGLNKATVLRILRTLEAKGLVGRVGPRDYCARFLPLVEKRYRIGYAAQSSVVPFTSVVTDGVVEAAYAANIDLVMLNNNYSAAVALRNADRFLAEGVHLVIESQISTRVGSALAAKFSKANVPYIAVDVPHPDAVYFGADNYKAGRIAGQYLAQWALKNWGGKVDQLVFAEVDASGHALDARITGIFDAIVKVLPEVRRIPVYSYGTKAQFETALEIFRKHIRLRGANHVLVGAVNDPSALGALQAFREFGAEEHCAISGQGACLEARDEMRRRKTRLVCSTAYFPENYGKQLIRLAVDVLNGRQVPRAVFIEHELVTPANVDKVYPNDMLLKTGLTVPARS